MKNKHEDSSAWSFVDLFTSLLCFMTVMFLLAAALINEKKKEDSGVRPKAEYIIMVQWDNQKFDADVDTWLQDPLGNVINFHIREAGQIYLDRDSMGKKNNSYDNGQTTVVLDNVETATIRGIVEGEYTLNVHLFGAKTPDGSRMQDNVEALEPIPVTVQIIKVNPKVEEVFRKTVMLTKTWEELTVTRFTLSKDKITNFNSDYKALKS